MADETLPLKEADAVEITIDSHGVTPRRSLESHVLEEV